MRKVGGSKPSNGRKSAVRRAEDPHRIAAPSTDGARASLEWVTSLGLVADKPWYVEVALDVVERPATATYSGDSDTRLHLNIYPEEWGIFFCHGSRASWIRITDQPFVHGRDDYQLLGELPALATIGSLVHTLEDRHAIRFQREHALVRTNVTGGKPVVRKWLASL